MRPATIEESWTRIENWLSEHAPLSRTRLRPPARPEDISAAEQTLGLRFHPDLIASLLRHDGVEQADGTPELSYFGPLAPLSELVQTTLATRGTDPEGSPESDGEDEEENEEGDEEEAAWHPQWVLITLGIGWQATDGLFLSCLPGPHHGQIGEYVDEDFPAFTDWPSLGHLLADYAEALEQGRAFEQQLPVTEDGVLLWKPADAGGAGE
ncbi:SMI1/KNR4 family protein [Streptomyces sp. NPDC097619]|uniref:SMI1/KNR4 family protein n=1 Tax=Streptomyces sp. NPDC097619 TaxID=3157228 RepID=UPI00331FE77D